MSLQAKLRIVILFFVVYIIGNAIGIFISSNQLYIFLSVVASTFISLLSSYVVVKVHALMHPEQH
jgi:hypothetical protein